VLAVGEDRDIGSDLIPRIATGFCGGMARTNGICGAVTGGVLAINLILGRNTLDDPRDENYAAVAGLIGGFREKFGSTNCGELLGCDLGTPEGQAFYGENELRKRCRHFTEEATRLVMEMLGTE
jgi:C_GCAxxG_C_C family probable redox protein